MLKFLKFGDDAEALNAKDALLLWVQNKTASYANIKVDNFKKSFKDGLALCAIIHKHRPNLVDYDSLAPVCLFSFSTRIVIVVVVVVVVIVAVVVVIVVVGGGGKITSVSLIDSVCHLLLLYAGSRHDQHQDRHECGRDVLPTRTILDT
jgi:hypothetical protein